MQRRTFLLLGAAASGVASLSEAPTARTSSGVPAERRISLNGAWLFRLDPHNAGIAEKWFTANDAAGEWRPVRVPHTWQIESANAEYRGVGWYRRTFESLPSWADSALRIEF